MKISRFKTNDVECYGIVDGETIKEIQNPFTTGEILQTGKRYKLDEVKILAPSIPSKIVALGYNYKDLVGELEFYNEPVMFLKPPSSIIGTGEEVTIFPDMKTWSEVELAIVIGKKCKNVSVEEASKCIFGFTIGNDITMDNILERDHHLARSKALDTFCPLGPFIETEIDTSDLILTNKINGQIFQDSKTSNRILNDHEVVSYVSKFMTLLPGDIIMTGTPANAENSVIKDKDILLLEINGLGQLNNSVKSI